MIKHIGNLAKRWWREEDALAAIESAYIFPIMLVILVGVFDVGNAILANQKTVRASQVVADLIARVNVVSDADINEAIEAGRLAFEPLDSSSFGVDVVSIRFDDETGDGEIVWRETENMSPAADPLASVQALEQAGEGVVMVSVEYDYQPIFAGFVIDAFTMTEVAFSRGRRSPVVSRQ